MSRALGRPINFYHGIYHAVVLAVLIWNGVCFG